MALLKICLLGVALFVGASASNVAILEENQFLDETKLDLNGMEKAFLRSDETHTQSMANIMSGMTMQHAEEVIQRNNLSSPALMQITDMMKNSNLRRAAPKGYSGIDGARKLLNDMIYEAMMKYDQEIAKCTEYYSLQCMAMEVMRGEIAASNYIASNSRSLILDSQATINKCEVDIPTTQLELKDHNRKCEQELKKMRTRLQIVMGDIAVMTTILEMTDCDKKFVQMEQFALLHCHDKCNKGSFVTFNDASLQQKVSQLQGEQSKKLLSDTLTDLAAGIEGLEMSEEVSLFEIKSHLHQESVDKQDPVVNKTKFNNPPLPRTQVPGNPCNDPNAGAPSASKRGAKCTIKKSPQCYKLQERFLLIQSGIQDERDDLNDEIQKLEDSCAETKKTLETEIADDQDMLEAAQTKLAQATEKEATAAEKARQTAIKHEQMEHDLNKQMKTCSQNYINLESEMCALKKIRGELYKMKGGGHSAFFQDCEVSKWNPEECTKSCSGGTQKLKRDIMTTPDKGTACLPLEAIRSCSTFPCPVDCKLNAWSGWSKCSAECGGGVQQRLREVKTAMKYGGKPCGQTTQTKSCSNQACERDCDLSDWSRWGPCSKDCDGGTRKRQKFVTLPPQGQGKCADEWDPTRLQYKPCNMQKCVLKSAVKPLECNKSIDVVLLLDGSGSLGKTGWAAEIKAANLFVEAFMQSSGAQAEMSVILYSGPRTWSGVGKCVRKGIGCQIETVTDFTSDMKNVKTLINKLTWPSGSTLTSLALLKAASQLSLGRQDAQGIVVAITDGRPLSYRATTFASRLIRKKARLVWVPVTKYAPLQWIKKWATRRWQENVVVVKTFDDLEKPDPINHIIANICPKSNPNKVKMPRGGR